MLNLNQTLNQLNFSLNRVIQSIKRSHEPMIKRSSNSQEHHFFLKREMMKYKEKNNVLDKQLTGYKLFFRQKMFELKENPLSSKQKMIFIGQMWKQLSKEDKLEWKYLLINYHHKWIGYNLFIKQKMDERRYNTNLIGQMWKQLSDEDKQKWINFIRTFKPRCTCLKNDGMQCTRQMKEINCWQHGQT